MELYSSALMTYSPGGNADGEYDKVGLFLDTPSSICVVLTYQTIFGSGSHSSVTFNKVNCNCSGLPYTCFKTLGSLSKLIE